MMPCKGMSSFILRYQMYQRFFSALTKSNVANVSTKQTDEKKVQVDEDHQFGKKQTIRKLQQLLGISAFTAQGIANTYRNLSFVNGKMMTHSFEILRGAGIRNDTIIKYPSLLGAKDLERNLLICRGLTDDMNDVAPFLALTTNVVQSMFVKGVSRNRLELLSKLLQMPKSDLCEALIAKPFLRSINCDRVNENINVLLGNVKETVVWQAESNLMLTIGIWKTVIRRRAKLHICINFNHPTRVGFPKKLDKIINFKVVDNGIPIKDVHRDLWVLNYSIETVKNRLELAQSMRVEQIKTWMVRCTPEVLDRYVARRTDNKQILGNNSLAEYLSERLECSVEEAKVLMHKHPALQNKSMKKMKEILDFLFSQGFKPSQICRVPKILLHSVETTKQRLKELEPFGKHLDSLYLLTKSKKQYMQYFEALVKASNKTKSTN